jgi:hypothetical protein
MPIIIVDVASGVADMLEEVLKASYFFIFSFNFAIIMHSWQGRHNGMVPITVGPINR